MLAVSNDRARSRQWFFMFEDFRNWGGSLTFSKDRRFVGFNLKCSDGLPAYFSGLIGELA